MKKYLLYIGLVGLAACSPKLDRSIVPAPAPAPTIQIGDIQKFTLDNGLQVFVVENHKLPTVSFSLIFDVDPINEGPQAGLVDITSSLMGTGTTTRTKDEINESVDFIGASLNAGASFVSGSCLSKHKNTLIDVFADVAMNPKFTAEEFEKAMTQMEANLAQGKDDPSTIAANVKAALNYGKSHPYGEVVTEKTLKNVQLESCQAYASTFLKPNVAYLAIVGDVTLAEAKAMAEEKFAAWEKGNVPTFNHATPEPVEKTEVAFVAKRGAAQSVINITRPINLKPGSDDVMKADVMNAILGASSLSRLFANLRETYGFTYGAYSSIAEDELVGHFTASSSVRNEVTDSAIVQFFVEIEKIRNEPATQEELDGVIANMTGNFARALENASTVASFAINIDRYGLPQDYYATYLQRLSQVTLADVQAMAKKYLDPSNMTILVVGSEEEVLPTLDQFGEVTVYDIYGDVRLDLEPAPEGVTAESVLNAYIDAIGGAKKVKAVKSYKLSADLAVQGMTLQMETSYMKPNMMKNQILMGGNPMQTEIFDGTKGKVSGMGGEQVVEGEDAVKMSMQARIFPELDYEALGVSTDLLGVGELDGKKVYHVKISGPGVDAIEMYDVESGLKVASDGAQGLVKFGEYKSYSGVKMPATTSMSAGGQSMQMTVTDVNINKSVSKSDFEIK